ncbi:MAG: hypothetical protein IPQ14_14590 [Candidatus Microthrix sp.]|nr:hypothetical protein [Candidatus Microthrix sp.]
MVEQRSTKGSDGTCADHQGQLLHQLLVLRWEVRSAGRFFQWRADLRA